MRLTDFVHTIGTDWKYLYHGNVGKLSLSGKFSCPNRDGTIGIGGCTFCSVGSFSEVSSASVQDQIRSQTESGFDYYYAYFQSYTSTYAEVRYLKELYDQALMYDGVVGLCVGTRPDCCPDECLDLLSAYRDLGKDVIVELGLQTALDQTLKNINRGHDFSSYARTAERIRRRNLKICTHLILGLPGESLEDNIFSLNAVLEAGTDGIKLHPLHIVRGSIMAKQYRAGEIRLLSLDEYTGRACELIARTPARIVFHRISATARSPFLMAPDYCEKKFPVIDSITCYLSRYGVQGSAIGDPFIPELFFADN